MKSVLMILFVVIFGFSLMCCKNTAAPVQATVDYIEIDEMETEGYSPLNFVEWVPATVYYSDGTTNTAYQVSVDRDSSTFGMAIMHAIADDDPSVSDSIDVVINGLEGLTFINSDDPETFLYFSAEKVFLNAAGTGELYSIEEFSVSFNIDDGLIIAVHEPFYGSNDTSITVTGSIEGDFILN